MKKNKKTILLLVGCILILTIIVGISFAATRANVTSISQTDTSINTIVIKNSECTDVEMSCLNIVPGDRCTKEYSIENPDSNKIVVFNLYMEDTTNEFASDLNDLVYTLKDKTTGETIIGETVMPGTNSGKYYLLQGIELPPNTTKTYQFVIDYKYLPNIDQSSFQGSEFKTGFCADIDQITCDHPCNGECPEVGDIVSGSDNCCTEKVEEVTKVIGNTYCTHLITNPYCQPDPTCTEGGNPSGGGENPSGDPSGDPGSSGNPGTPPTPTTIEEAKECINDKKTKKIYGDEVVIHHDLYYADQSLYSTGKNKRYVTYCRPWKKGEEYGVQYCNVSNGKKKCKNVNRKVCNYKNAMKDFENVKTSKQAFVENFMDTGWNEGGVTTNNWHIKSFCNKAGAKTNWPGNGNGTYYCNSDATVLHDWYATTSSSVDDISISNICVPSNLAYHGKKCQRANPATLHTETCYNNWGGIVLNIMK